MQQADPTPRHHRTTAVPAAGKRGDWFSWLLGRMAFYSAVRPEITLSLAAILTCWSAVFAWSCLEFRTSRLDLLSDSAGYNQRWLTYLERFGNDDDAVVVVSHAEPKRVELALAKLGATLDSDAELNGVLYRKSVGNISRKALHLLPAEQLQQLVQLLVTCEKLIPNGASPGSAIIQASHLQTLTSQLSAAVAEAQQGLDRLHQSVPEQGPLLLEDAGRLGICLVRLPHLDDKPTEARAGIERLNEHLKSARAADPELDIWLTGMPVLEWDESQSSQRDMQNATLLSLAGVACILVFGFGSWRMPIAAVACLTVGLIWTVGLATLCVGHLNLFSVAFGAIIAGLGIDYAIHLLTRIQSQCDHPNVDDLPMVLSQAVAHCGKGVVTGAVTTAAAFAVAVLTPFKGMTELGIVCALGTLACVLVTLWVLPAVLVLQARWLPQPVRNGSSASDTSSTNTTRSGTTRNALGIAGCIDLDRIYRAHTHCLRVLNAWNRRQRLGIVCTIGGLTLLAGLQMGDLRYDHNLLNLQADDVPSVRAELELTRRSGQSAWFAICMASSPEQASQLHRRLENLPSVARVEEIGSVLASAAAHPQTSELVTLCRHHAQQLNQQFDYLSRQPLAGQSPIPVAHPLGNGPLVQLANHTSRPDQSSHVPTIDSGLVSQIQLLTRSIEAVADSEPPRLSDFPAAVQCRMASQDGQTFLLRVFAKQNLWQRENLGQFVRELESVDPKVTGHPIQTWYASGELEKSYYQAGIYAFFAVAALLMIDLGSLRLVTLSLIPVGLSMIQLCGLLVTIGIPFNAANMIVLPLIIGIGIDDGVHIMHDFSMRGRRSYSISSSTTLAVLLTSLTTMVGFGCMGIADHRGLQSLGIVLLFGVGLCLLNSWFTLPAILSFFGPRELEAHGMDPATPSPAPSAAAELSEQEQALQSARVLLNDIPVVLSLPDYPNMPV